VRRPFSAPQIQKPPTSDGFSLPPCRDLPDTQVEPLHPILSPAMIPTVPGEVQSNLCSAHIGFWVALASLQPLLPA
jgi:hypothetical protein